MNKMIGVSCYNQPALAQKAQADGADYIAFGAFNFETKPNQGIVKLVCVSAAQIIFLLLVLIALP